MRNLSRQNTGYQSEVMLYKLVKNQRMHFQVPYSSLDTIFKSSFFFQNQKNCFFLNYAPINQFQIQMSKRTGLYDIVNKLVEVVPNRLFLYVTPKSGHEPDQDSIFSFNIDDILSYLPFHSDFGPLKISCIYQYVQQINLISGDPIHKNKQFWHITSSDPKKYINSILLICSYAMLSLGKKPEQAFQPFQKYILIGFRDSSSSNTSFELSILDCLRGLAKSTSLGWFNMKTFSVDNYQHYQKTQLGDINQIIKNKLFAFSSPSGFEKDKFGKKLPSCAELAKTLKSLGISSVILLSQEKQFANKLKTEEIDVHFVLFPDFTAPQSILVDKFISVIEGYNQKAKIGVSCRTGLGKTGTMIGCYVIKKFQFSAVQYISWVRFCRPGSVIGPQQQFLLQYNKKINIVMSNGSIGSESGKEQSPTLTKKRNPSSIKREQSKSKVEELGKSERLKKKYSHQRDWNSKESPKKGKQSRLSAFNIDQFLQDLKMK